MNIKENCSIDILKLICAACVCATHAGVVHATGMYWTHGLTQTALIIFFISSGFFLKRNNTLQDNNKGINYVKRLVVLLAFWIPMYILWNIYISNDRSITAIYEIANDAVNDVFILNN